MKPSAPAGNRSLYTGIAIISAVGLAYELVLMRIFAITQWHHFAYMIISIALLGYGSAGTLFAFLAEKVKSREIGLLSKAAVAFVFSLPASYFLSQRIPFETFQLTTDPKQLLYLLLTYLALALPFFLCSACITLALLLRPKHTHRIYGISMIGSGAGALLATSLMFHFSPSTLPALLTLIAAGGSLAFLTAGKQRVRTALLAGAMLAAGALTLAVPARISQYKGLACARQLPDSQIVARACSPMAEVTAVRSSLIRETPGQLAGYSMHQLGPLPPQIALYFDAGGSSVINRFDGDLTRFAFLDYVTAALPYHLIEKPKTLVAGAGGGTDVLMALAHGAPSVTAVEVDPSVFPLINRRFAEFSGGLYQRSDVIPVHAEARHFLQTTGERYDLLHVSLLDSFTTSASGVYALSENYLYTREALRLYIRRLRPGGILSITRWIKTPARDTIKLFATAVEALEQESVKHPGRHLLWIRSWNTGTVLVSKTPWTDQQLENAFRFCKERSLDLCHMPGLQPEQANRFTILPNPVYFNAAHALLSADRSAFYRNVLFHIRPATDNSPFFFRFFKWSAIKRLLEGMGTEWIPFIEWGYLALLATLTQSILTALILILAPLIAFRHKGISVRKHAVTISYFGLIGMAYMFLEIAFIQKLMLFLAYPIYAVAVVLLSFLLFSGIGGWLLADRAALSRKLYTCCLGGLLLAAALTGAGLKFCAVPLMGWPDPARIAAAVALLAPLAFLMGIPFPAGLQTTAGREAGLLPWAWGINGFLSVIAAPLATLIAMHAGLFQLILTSATLYLLAALLFGRLNPHRKPPNYD